jgi:methanogenic corrinoid protein MtbC1
MVRKALKRAGFKTVDLGKAVSPQNFVAKAKEVNADIIAVSINTKPAKDNLPKLSQAFTEAGLKGKVVLMIGGAAVTKEDADAVGTLYGKSKEEAVAIAQKAMEEKRKK